MSETFTEILVKVLKMTQLDSNKKFKIHENVIINREIFKSITEELLILKANSISRNLLSSESIFPVL